MIAKLVRTGVVSDQERVRGRVSGVDGPAEKVSMQDISPDMRDLLQLLLRHEVKFAVCGGFAVSYYGFIRTTLDLDLLVFPSTENAERMMRALAAFGFGGAGIPEAKKTRN
ncbi:MAG: hypothetical protein WCR06_08610 [bacterium]